MSRQEIYRQFKAYKERNLLASQAQDEGASAATENPLSSLSDRLKEILSSDRVFEAKKQLFTEALSGLLVEEGEGQASQKLLVSSLLQTLEPLFGFLQHAQSQGEAQASAAETFIDAITSFSYIFIENEYEKQYSAELKATIKATMPLAGIRAEKGKILAESSANTADLQAKIKLFRGLASALGIDGDKKASAASAQRDPAQSSAIDRLGFLSSLQEVTNAGTTYPAILDFLKELREETDELRQDNYRLRQAASSARALNASVREEGDRLDETAAELREESDQLKLRATALDTRERAIEGSEAALREREKALADRLEKLEADKARLTSEREAAAERQESEAVAGLEADLERKESEIQQFSARNQVLVSQLQELRAQLAQLSEQRAAFEQASAQQSRAIADLERQLARITREKEDLSQELQARQQEQDLSQAQARVRPLGEELSFTALSEELQQENQRLSRQLEIKERELEERRKELAEALARLGELQSTSSTFNDRWREITQSAKELRDQISEKDAIIASKERELREAQATARRAAEERDTAQQRITALEQQLAETGEGRDAAAGEREAALRELAALRQQLAQEQDAARQRIAALEQQLAETGEGRDAAARERDAATGRAAELQQQLTAALAALEEKDDAARAAEREAARGREDLQRRLTEAEATARRAAELQQRLREAGERGDAATGRAAELQQQLTAALAALEEKDDAARAAEREAARERDAEARAAQHNDGLVQELREENVRLRTQLDAVSRENLGLHERLGASLEHNARLQAENTRLTGEVGRSTASERAKDDMIARLNDLLAQQALREERLRAELAQRDALAAAARRDAPAPYPPYPPYPSPHELRKEGRDRRRAGTVADYGGYESEDEDERGEYQRRGRGGGGRREEERRDHSTHNDSAIGDDDYSHIMEDILDRISRRLETPGSSAFLLETAEGKDVSTQYYAMKAISKVIGNIQNGKGDKGLTESDKQAFVTFYYECVSSNIVDTSRRSGYSPIPDDFSSCVGSFRKNVFGGDERSKENMANVRAMLNAGEDLTNFSYHQERFAKERGEGESSRRSRSPSPDPSASGYRAFMREASREGISV